MAIPDEPERTKDEKRRKALSDYRLLDENAEAGFDRIVQVASKVTGLPIAHISFLDTRKQWFKAFYSEAGAEQWDARLCDHCVRNGKLTEIPDLSKHPDFKDLIGVSDSRKIRAYLSAPIVDPEGNVLGTICVADTSPREFVEKDRLLITELAEHTMELIEVRLQEKLKEKARWEVSREILEAEENTRRRIGQDIHDGIAQHLTAARLFFKLLEEAVASEEEEDLGQFLDPIREALDSATQEVGEVSHDLTLKHFQNGGLLEGVKALLSTYDGRAEGLKASLKAEIDEDSLSPFIQKNIYRIVQELLNNTLKHSQASVLAIELSIEGNELLLSSCDNGSGLGEEEAKDLSSFQSIRGRVSALEGGISILPAESKGLSYEIRLPLT
jgi:NarL family two-component system sensor histidine kinase LiaS